jgi:hypothetical protein
MSARVGDQPSQVQELAALPSMKIERTLKDKVLTVFLTVITLGVWIPVAAHLRNAALKRGDIESASKWHRLTMTMSCCFDSRERVVKELITNKQYLSLKFMTDNEFRIFFTVAYSPMWGSVKAVKNMSKVLFRTAILGRNDDLYVAVLHSPDVNTKLGRKIWNHQIDIITEKKEGAERRKASLEIASYLANKNFSPRIPNFDAKKWVAEQPQKIAADVEQYPIAM